MERIPKLIKFPADLVKKIEEFQEQNHLSSFAVAVEDLVKSIRGQCLRLAHSLREGTMSASLIMGKLGSYSRQNSLATSLKKWAELKKRFLF